MRWIAVIASFGIGLAAPAGALAAGGPVPPVQGQTGVGVPGSPFQFIALPAGRDTLVQRVRATPWRVQFSRRVAGGYGIPGADLNGSTTGLSADGRTLILEQTSPNGVVRTTRLLVLDARRLRVRQTIVLPGWSNVDAISPDGRWIYLIHYPSLSDLTRYEVRAYDLRHRRLLSQPIVDPHDRGERMAGIPFRRIMSLDGRWAYTLYGRPSGAPFIHALDTVGVRAVCVDLPSSLGADVGNARLQLAAGGRTLEVSVGGLVQATINTRTFAVRSGVAAAAPAPARPAVQEERTPGAENDLPWGLAALSIVALAGFGAALWRRSSRRAH
jgi:hypothetical protein